MISFIISLRVKQVYRYLQELGWLRAFLLVAVVIIFLPRFLVELWMNNPYYVAAFWGFTLLSVHLQRSDHYFLQSIAIRRVYLYTLEYMLLSGVFVGLYIQQQYWWGAVLILLEATLLPWLPRFKGFVNKQKGTYWWEVKTILPPIYFEWIAGIRQRFWYVGLLWILGLIFCWFAPVVPVVNLLLSLSVIQFYQLCEPKEMAEVVASSPISFVRWKVKQGLKLFGVFTLPMWIGFLIANPSLWFILPTVWFMVALWLSLAILAKYAAYDPGENLSQNNTLMGLAIMFTFLPPFSFLINVFWIIRYYRRAIHHMKNYIA